ncbi:hypothetical protein [Streptomyces rimosus]|uniref:hypothetical protein n=1 Tax=Streptomyces rimosus TaxID=1927 RepID=UPI000AAFC04E|nr:hypothetical protein [Streptomyces rimosus]
MLITALLPLPYATATAATAATATAAAPHGTVLTHSSAAHPRTLPHRNQGPGRPEDADHVDHAEPPGHHEPPSHGQAPNPDADTGDGTSTATPANPTSPLDALGRLIPLGPGVLAPSGGPVSGSGTDDTRPALPQAPGPPAPNDLSADAEAQLGHASRPSSPAASKPPGKASPAPTRPRRNDLAGRLAHRPYVPLPPLQAPASSAVAARPHGSSRYAPGAVPGAASAAERSPGTAAEQGNGVHRVLPLGAGMALTGLGLAFIALRLRRS